MNNKFSLLLILVIGIMPITQLHAGTYVSGDLNQVDTSKCFYTFDVSIDTEGKDSNAADLILKYNPNEVTIVDADQSQDGTQVVVGDAYESYIYNKADDTKGEITVTAIRFDSLNGNQIFVRIPFIAKIANPTFKVDFEGVGNTYDSNIAESSTSLDILTHVDDIPFQIKDFSCGLTAKQVSEISIEKGIKPVEVKLKNDYNLLLFFIIISLLFIPFISLVLFKRIRVVSTKNIPLPESLIKIYKNNRLIRSYVTNSRGFVWVLRRDYRNSIEVSNKDYKTLEIKNTEKHPNVIKLEAI